jgi:hypothetical protein
VGLVQTHKVSSIVVFVLTSTFGAIVPWRGKREEHLKQFLFNFTGNVLEGSISKSKSTPAIDPLTVEGYKSSSKVV